MAILFQRQFVDAIREGRKTVTRRRGKRRWKVGSIHQCYTRPAFARPPGQPFARVQIVSVFFEPWPGHGCNREWDARCEGFSSWEEFLNAYTEINGVSSTGEGCWRVEFALVTETREPALAGGTP